MTAEEIFTLAKSKFVYASDAIRFGEAEHWATYEELQAALDQTGKLIGDCEDFSGWCVHALRQAGLPARYVLCQTETGDWHCVAETEGNILDNRQQFITPQQLLPYKWHSISGYAPGEAWKRIV